MSPGRGAAGPGRRLMRESQDKAVSHYWGLVWGNHTPRGWWCALGSSSSSSSGCRRRRSSHSQAWERRQLRQGRGLGPWKEALQGQGLAGPRGTVPGWARAWELDKGKDSAVSGPLPLPTGPTSPVSPLQQTATAEGLGVPNTGAPAPLCRAARVLLLLWLSLPAPLSLPGDGEAGRGLVAPRAPSPRTA